VYRLWPGAEGSLKERFSRTPAEGDLDRDADVSRGLESGTKVGEATPRAPRVRRLVEAGVPAVKVAGELVVEDACTDLQQKVGAVLCPAHLLFPGHALADDLVDR
jgi:hypothetical protein